MSNSQPLEALEAGMRVIAAGNRIVSVPSPVAERFRPGDSLVYVDDSDELLLIPSGEKRAAADAVDGALRAFRRMNQTTDAQIDQFYELFASSLESEEVWGEIREANQLDVEAAKRRKRSTTRLVASEELRRGMIEGLRAWRAAGASRGRVLETVRHEGWSVERTTAALGVVAFVFEGRPNVLADATGVLRGGNTVVFRIGRDALGTARAIMRLALVPALDTAGLPPEAVRLVESAEHAAGWALFTDRRLSLAVARGSGRAVALLGALAKQSGVPVSLHGTGGAWVMASQSTRPDVLRRVVARSLDRKVCNTLNVCCMPRQRQAELLPAFLDGLQSAAEQRGQAFRLHVVEGAESPLLTPLFERRVRVARAEGPVEESQASWLQESQLGREWEWEESPEVSLCLVDDLEQATALCNRYSPRFVASLLSDDEEEQQRFFALVDAPFVGDDHTRWVDGQYALGRPELGLSNWEYGRLMARGGILSGDGIYTVRTRARRA